MHVVAYGISDVGLQREHNEDSFAVLEDYELFIVADGMGGHRAGDVASKLATESIGEFFKKTAQEDATWPFHFDSRLSEEENRLLMAIRVANRQIYEHSSRSRDLRGMGTTVVGALFAPKKSRLYIGHVGDSRAYRVRNGQIEQLTRDHSLVNDYLAAMPDMTDEQRSELPKNVITRALGMQDNVEVDLQSSDCKVGDLFVLCSDGLSGMITDNEIREVVTEGDDLEQACGRLVNMANEHGGEDNITAVVLRVEESTERREISFGDTDPLLSAKLSATRNDPEPASVNESAPTVRTSRTEPDTPAAGTAAIKTTEEPEPPPSTP